MITLNKSLLHVATQHREDVATSATMQRRYGYVVTHVATPKDGTITGKTSTNNRAKKGTHHIQRNTLKTSPLRFPPSAFPSFVVHRCLPPPPQANRMSTPSTEIYCCPPVLLSEVIEKMQGVGCFRGPANEEKEPQSLLVAALSIFAYNSSLIAGTIAEDDYKDSATGESHWCPRQFLPDAHHAIGVPRRSRSGSPSRRAFAAPRLRHVRPHGSPTAVRPQSPS